MILKGIIPALLYVFLCTSAAYAIDLGGITKFFGSAKMVAESITKAARPISDEEEYYVGRAVAAKILGTYKLLENKELTLYVNLVGRTITLSSDKPFTYGGYHFGVLDTDEVNAFACPGGTILITKGMIKTTRSEDELAAVLAHEVAHISKRDGIGAISSSRWTEALTVIGSEAAKTYGPSDVSKLVGIFEGSIDDVFKTLVVNGYGKSQEFAADTSALQYLEKSGYNPAALNDFLKHLSEIGQASGGGITKTHPGTPDRIKNISGKLPSDTIDPQALQKRTARFSAVPK
jgi:predicted Zn-dependent protease